MIPLRAAFVAAGLVLVAAAVVARLARAARAARAGRAAGVLGAGPSPKSPTPPERAPRRVLAAAVLARPTVVLDASLRAADLDIDAGAAARRWALATAVAVVVAPVRWGAGGVVVAMSVAVGGPVAVLAWRRGREAQRFAAALPGLLETVAGKLRAGASLPEAVSTSAADRTGSTSLDGDLRALAARVDHGQPFRDAVEGWAAHRPLPAVGLVAAALVLGAEAGGARAKALDGVAATLRDRRALAAEVDALSSQARASAVVMMGAPVVFAALGLLSDPAVSAFLLRTPAGLGCLVGGLLLDAIAGMWMMRIADASAVERDEPAPGRGASGARSCGPGHRTRRQLATRRFGTGAGVMAAGAVGLGTTAMVAVGAWRGRPAPARARALVAAAGAGPSSPPRVDRSPRRVGRSVERLGRVVRARLGRPHDPRADRHLGRALLAGTAVAFVSPLLVVLVAGWWWAAPLFERRRRQRRNDAAVLGELPEVVDLFVLAVGAGLTVALAVPAVARHHRGVVGTALGDVSRRVALGARLADALADLPAAAGERVRPLAAVLVASDRYGVALLPALERLAAETRLERRRAAEAAARRVPVKLLFPLVLCTLPAFALLTVVPLLAGSLRSLRL